MPYEVFLAFRYLRSRHKRRLARVTAVVAVLGISMGVAALIIALALSNGFRDEMRDKILRGTAHINVLRSDGLPIVEGSTVKNRIRQVPGVARASSTTYDGAVARGPKGSAYAVLRGVEEGAAEESSLRSWLVKGTMFVQPQPGHEPQAVIGIELANRLGVSTGEVLQVIPAGIATNAVSITTRRLQVA